LHKVFVQRLLLIVNRTKDPWLETCRFSRNEEQAGRL
jgi:hypothetical protein